jgi:hypothetical protein
MPDASAHCKRSAPGLQRGRARRTVRSCCRQRGCRVQRRLARLDARRRRRAAERGRGSRGSPLPLDRLSKSEQTPHALEESKTKASLTRRAWRSDWRGRNLELIWVWRHVGLSLAPCPFGVGPRSAPPRRPRLAPRPVLTNSGAEGEFLLRSGDSSATSVLRRWRRGAKIPKPMTALPRGWRQLVKIR